MEIIIIALIILLGVREYLSSRERADMLDRLMSRNIQEYKDNTENEENELEVESSTIPIDQAKEEING